MFLRINPAARIRNIDEREIVDLSDVVRDLLLPFERIEAFRIVSQRP